MSKNEINNALSKGRSKHVGQATDDSIILELINTDFVDTDGGEKSPLTIIMQKLSSGTNRIIKIIDENVANQSIKSIHIPPQISIIEIEAFLEATNCEKANLENIEVAKQRSFVALAAEREQPIKVHLNNIVTIGEEAFGYAKAIIYMNEKVAEVGDHAFEEVPELHYKGKLPGAPWGAQEWIKD